MWGCVVDSSREHYLPVSDHKEVLKAVCQMVYFPRIVGAIYMYCDWGLNSLIGKLFEIIIIINIYILA